MPQLDQRRRDVLALALIAAGVFMGFVLYAGGSADAGGGVGHALAVALGWAAGRARVLAPIALVGAGGAMLMRPVLPALRPLRTGSVCLFGAIVLALAAGTLGVSDGQSGSGARWSSHFLQARGGAAGEALYVGAHGLVQQVGVDILVVFLFVVGVILLTGASLATVLRATGNGVADSTRIVVSRARAGVAGAERSRSARGGSSAMAARTGEADPLVPPEPEPGKLVVRATHVEAPSLDERELLQPLDPWAQEDASSGAGEMEPGGEGEAGGRPDEESEPKEERPIEDLPAGVAATDAESLTPRGRLRDVVTDDPNFVWRIPEAARVLSRSTAEQSRPDTAGQERTATSLVEALGHFGVQAKVIGTVAGPAHHPLRAAPRAGDEGGEGDAAEGRPRVCAGGDGHPHPRADPGQAGGGGGGAERAAADRAPGRRLPGAPGGLVAADGVAGEGRGGEGDRGGPREDAAPAGGGHHGGGEVGGDQRDARERAAAREPARTAPRAGGPQAGGAQPLRVDPAPADPGDHEPEDGGERAGEPGAGDGGALRDDVAGAHAEPAGAQQACAKAAGRRRCRTSCA